MLTTHFLVVLLLYSCVLYLGEGYTWLLQRLHHGYLCSLHLQSSSRGPGAAESGNIGCTAVPRDTVSTRTRDGRGIKGGGYGTTQERPAGDPCSSLSGTTVASRNVRAGTTLHELTHAVASTIDITYGCSADQALSAADQLNNADNYNVGLLHFLLAKY
ncbi:hypothetical protein DL96DRAFT_1634838 [Flagelloscypha sp. PMI_526]|nr:hypothetical protein DL96DRAFT_1634838 [Flagelloscypha sp. PMI_526]